MIKGDIGMSEVGADGPVQREREPHHEKYPRWRFIESWNEVARAINEINVEKGFWEPSSDQKCVMSWLVEVNSGWLPDDVRDAMLRLAQYNRNDGEALMLMVSELAEGIEGIRSGARSDDKVPQFSPIEAELADCVIRIMDYAHGKNLRVAEALTAKLEYNRSRPHKHGKQF